MTTDEAVTAVVEPTIYAMSEAICCDCGERIPAMNEIALKLLNEHAHGLDIPCTACRVWKRERGKLLGTVGSFAEIPY